MLSFASVQQPVKISLLSSSVNARWQVFSVSIQHLFAVSSVAGSDFSMSLALITNSSHEGSLLSVLENQLQDTDLDSVDILVSYIWKDGVCLP